MAPLSKQKCNDCRNPLYDKSASFRCDGRLFHSPGPAAANPPLPNVLYVRVTTHVRLAVERIRRSRASATRWQLSAMYDGEMPDSDWWTNFTNLKSLRWRTGSQCNRWTTGIMWSERRVPVTHLWILVHLWTDFTDSSTFLSIYCVPFASRYILLP